MVKCLAVLDTLAYNELETITAVKVLRDRLLVVYVTKLFWLSVTLSKEARVFSLWKAFQLSLTFDGNTKHLLIVTATKRCCTQVGSNRKLDRKYFPG